jgi:hypothetical protein
MVLITYAHRRIDLGCEEAESLVHVRSSEQTLVESMALVYLM